MIRISIFLLMAALAVGMVSCGGESCAIVISSTEGGSVTSPGEGIFIYAEGTVVNLTAEAEGCYRFVNWTCNVSTIDSIEAATTSITISRSCFITASFANFEGETAYFADPKLESAVSEALNRPPESICLPMLERLRGLSVINRNITDLTGLEHCTELVALNLAGNQISNISLVENFVGLTWLSIERNVITDTSALTSLTGLDWLDLQENQISDLSPLTNLTSLEFLSLRHNQITDISRLTNLTHLTWLDLNSNQISDISSLMQNEGLDAGDVIYLEWNPLNSDSINIYIPELEARGVTVHY